MLMLVRNKHYLKLYTCNVDSLPRSCDLLPVPSPFDAEEASHLFPRNPSTGQLRDLLSQILTTENPLLRDSLLSKLETLSPDSSAFQGVDDATKLQLLKPRSLQSLSEMADYAKFVGSVLDELNVSSPSESTPAPESTPVPQSTPVSESAPSE